MTRKFTILAGVAILLLFIVLGAINAPRMVTAAPPAAPTPVSADRGMIQPQVAALMAAESIDADTRGGCVNTAAYGLIDVQYTIDQGTANTTTLSLLHTNDDPWETDAVYVTGAAVASNVATDTTDMQQMNAFGAWTCIYANVTNTNTVVVSVKALVK